MLTLPKQPQGIARLLESGFRLFKTGLVGALGIMLIMLGSAVVLSILLSLVVGTAGSHIMSPENMGQMPAFGPGEIFAMLLSMLAYGLFVTYFFSALILHYAAIAYRGESNLRETLSAAVSRLLPAFGSLLLMALFLFVCMSPALVYQGHILQKITAGEVTLQTAQLVNLVLELPYFYFAITLVFTIYRAVIDRYGPLSAPIGSYKLVWGEFWRTALWLLSVYIIIAVVSLAVFYPLFSDATFTPQGVSGVSGSTAAIGVFAMFALLMIFLPFITAMTIPYYHDLKLRKHDDDNSLHVIAA
jgi:hypothetical protein